MGTDKNGSSIMARMNNYIRTRRSTPYKKELSDRYQKSSLEDLIRLYKHGDLPEDEKQFVLDSLFIKLFFYFPSFLGRKKYKLNVNLYDEALQNISHKILVALERFDPDKGYPFIAYAYGDLVSAMTQTFKELNIVQLPMGGRAGNVQKSRIRTDTEEDAVVADRSENPPCDVDYFVKNPEVGLAEPVEDAENAGDTPLDITPDAVLSSKAVAYSDTNDAENFDYEKDLHTKQLVEWLEEALSDEACVLTEDERLVVTLHNGLFGHEPMIYSDIADVRKQMGKGCSRSRISQIHTKALKKLRTWFKAMRIEP